MQINSLLVPFILFAVVAVASILFRKIGRKKAKTAEPKPYKARDLMTPTEQKLFFRLKEALPSHFHVHAQVALSRMLDVDRKKDFTAFSQVSQKSVDYVITITTPDKKVVVVAAIELDDKSHLKKDRQESDETKDRALAEAGIQLLRWNVKEMPSVETIREIFVGKET